MTRDQPLAPLTRQHTHMGKQTLFATDYHYDPVGNLTRREDSGFGVDTYLYDPMGRILAHTDPQGRIQRFLNDPAGDRLAARVATSQAGNDAAWERSGEHEGTRYRFNRAGNLVHRQDADGLLELEWDANQRLIASRRSGTNGQRLTTRYAYDPLGRRLWKETAGVRTTFGWDGDALALDATLGAVREFVYRPNTFEPLALLRNANAPPFTTSMTPTAARSA